jgi:hypothetical protein
VQQPVAMAVELIARTNADCATNTFKVDRMFNLPNLQETRFAYLFDATEHVTSPGVAVLSHVVRGGL